MALDRFKVCAYFIRWKILFIQIFINLFSLNDFKNEFKLDNDLLDTT